MAEPEARAARTAIEAVWRIESARVIAALTRHTRDVGRAEELAQDALLAALEQWPTRGVPQNPGAWLVGAAKHRAIDAHRQRALHDEKHAELGRELDEGHTPDWDERLDDPVGDDLLKLVFIACHPVLPPESRVALTLRLLGGLETGAIARAFLVPEATIAQRIVRAKKTLAEAKVPFEAPHGEALHERLGPVLEVIYLVFNEGYAATAGNSWIRRELCDEALRLGRIVSALMPHESEPHGLVALMSIQGSRFAARTGPDGQPVLLLDQNRAKWDRFLIQNGLAALARAESLAPQRGPYTLQAALAACHARAHVPKATDWPRIVALYDELLELSPSPVVRLNRAVAVGMAQGPAAALPLVDALAEEPALERYHLLPSVRADLLAKLGRTDEAKVELQRAAELTQNAREKTLLLERAAKL